MANERSATVALGVTVGHPADWRSTTGDDLSPACQRHSTVLQRDSGELCRAERDGRLTGGGQAPLSPFIIKHNAVCNTKLRYDAIRYEMLF